MTRIIICVRSGHSPPFLSDSEKRLRQDRLIQGEQMSSTIETRTPATSVGLTKDESGAIPSEVTRPAKPRHRSSQSRRRRVLSMLLGDAALASRRYVTSYRVGRGAE